MELPIKGKRSRGLTAQVNIMVTPEMKEELSKLDLFNNIEVSEWIRRLIQKGLDDLHARNQNV